MVEAGFAAVVGIWHLLLGEAPAELQQGRDRGAGTALTAEGSHGRQIFRVHRQDLVERLQIRHRELAGPAREVHTAALGGGAHARVGGLAHMPAAGAGRIHNEAPLQICLGQLMQEHSFGGWRTADVAEADKQHPGRCCAHGSASAWACASIPAAGIRARSRW